MNGDRAASEFEAFKRKYGMADGDWHVCLHMREAESRGETSGRGETIRNSHFEAHRDAVRYITERGGWVIKMGGPQTPRIPVLDRVIDYAHSDLRSELLDLHLVRTAKLFIGGASGFSYVATSFGVPTAMVNVISCISYLWPANCRFSYKPVRTKDGGTLSQHELTSSARWSFATFESTERAGLVVGERSVDEILETVKEVHALADGELQPNQTLIDDWRRSLALPAFYGSATPGRYFLEKNKGDILKGLV